jgi:glycosyltransferase involved in cell wall biosynthesis
VNDFFLNRVVVTFILPVLNRKPVILRAIASCLECQSESIEPCVLIVDGGSHDGTRELIEETYSEDHRVVFLTQPADQPGFMNACFFGVRHLKSPLATFMYSDDILSPNFVKLAEALLTDPDSRIAFGYGGQAAEDEVIDFSAITPPERVEIERVLYAYYGRVEKLDGKTLPVSPVCCLVRSPILEEWVEYVQEFTANNLLRHYSMIRLAGGPDLMIYLTALSSSSEKAIRTRSVIAQLTGSESSLSSAGNRETQLTVGYWQARVWGFLTMIKKEHPRLAGEFAGYLLAIFFYIMGKKITRMEFSWMCKIFEELWGVLKIVTKHRQLVSMLRGCLGSLASRSLLVFDVKTKIKTKIKTKKISLPSG